MVALKPRVGTRERQEAVGDCVPPGSLRTTRGCRGLFTGVRGSGFGNISVFLSPISSLCRLISTARTEVWEIGKEFRFAAKAKEGTGC
jgi:hypothetical protein